MNKTLKLWLFGVLASLVFAGTVNAQEEDDDEFGDDFAQEETGASSEAPALEWSGFMQLERADHVGDKSPADRKHLADELRFRLKTTHAADKGSMIIKLDFVQDLVTGTSAVDVREARILTTPASWLDLSLGKQVNTWGVGDMVFINDLFPKNWMAMFLGKDMEFLKEPANSYRASAYLGPITVDVVHHPKFAADVTPAGCTFAVFNPNSMLDSSQPSIAGGESACTSAASPNPNMPTEAEDAVRLKMQTGGWELAMYGYRGFYKNPKGMVMSSSTDGVSLSPIYPRMSSIGGSAEGPLGPGILSMEVGRYDSLDDPNGTNPLIENSANKGLIGYRLEFSQHISAGMQSMVESMSQADGYDQGILGMYQQMGLTAEQAAQTAAYKYRLAPTRHTYTLRLGFKAYQDTLWVNFFAFERPEDEDRYQKLEVVKRLSDALVLATGANVFSGSATKPDRDFGMLDNEDNGFVRVQYNF